MILTTVTLMLDDNGMAMGGGWFDDACVAWDLMHAILNDMCNAFG